MTLQLSTANFDLKKEALKQRLIDCVGDEKKQFLQMADQFYQLKRRSEIDYRRLCEAIIASADHVLMADDWDSSLFLRNTLKSLKKIREQALQLREHLGGSAEAKYTPPTLSEGVVKLYISLYQSNGHDLKLWASQLASISSHMIGRPVYESEEEAIKAIRRKLSQTSEAYAVVSVDKSKIVGADQLRPRKDRLGNTLINLLPGAITDASILEFVHAGKRYYFCDQRLVLLDNEVN